MVATRFDLIYNNYIHKLLPNQINCDDVFKSNRQKYNKPENVNMDPKRLNFLTNRYFIKEVRFYL